MRTGFSLVLLFAAFGCSHDAGPGPAIDLEDLPAERVDLDRSARDAFRFSPQDGAGAIALGVAGPDSVLRLGILPPEDGSAVSFTAYLGEEVLFSRQTTGPRRWHDQRIEIGSLSNGRQCRVRFEAAGPFWLAPCELAVPAQDQPNVLVFLIDALRQDHVSLYGYERATTPNIDAFAKDATVFTQMMPPSSWTRPSVASLWTGVYPETHGARDADDIMREGMPSLANALEGQGYATHAIMSNWNCLPQWGMGNDFAVFDFVPFHLEDNTVVDRAIEVLRQNRDRPWFLYVHLMGPHNPYWPPAPADFSRFQPKDKALEPEEIQEILGRCPDTDAYNEIRRVLGLQEHKPAAGLDSGNPPISIEALRQLCVDLYDGDIAFADTQFARLEGALKETGQYDGTMIIVTSDHGEEFWDHGGTLHAQTLYEEQLRVPFLVRMPGGPATGETRAGLVNMVDVAPSILETVGAAPEAGFQGQSFLPLLLRGEDDARPGYASLIRIDSGANLRAAKTPKWKYVHDLNAEREHWYDLVAAPGEDLPLEDAPEAARGLRSHARQRGMEGAAGLYLLITSDLDEPHEINGFIETASLGRADLRYPPKLANLSRQGDRLSFELQMQWQPGLAENRQDFQALFHVTAGAEEDVRLSVQLDGRDANPSEIHLGQEQRHAALDGAIPVQDLMAEADALKQALLPRQFGVYLWYVPSVEHLRQEDLDIETLENLEALGYLASNPRQDPPEVISR